MEQNIFYALKDNKLIHISNVENGLKCGCICPSCKGKMIAKKGKIKVHHFAHYNKDCGLAGETALHLKCKEIIEKNKTFWIPSVGIPYISALVLLNFIQMVVK